MFAGTPACCLLSWSQHELTLFDSLFLPTGGFSVFAGVGERTREGNDLYREMIESGACCACCAALRHAVVGRRRCARPALSWACKHPEQMRAAQLPCQQQQWAGQSMPCVQLHVLHRWPPHVDARCPAPRPAGVIKLGEQQADSKVTLVYGQMNEPPGEL